MVQSFYTLEEAASRLGMPPDELKRLWQQKKVHGFPDRNTVRFKTEVIEEFARQRGLQSDPDVGMGEAPTETLKKPSGEVFPFEVTAGEDSGTHLIPPRSKVQADSDSDVRLVAEGSDLEPGRPAKPPSGAIRAAKKGEDADSDVKLVDMSGGDVVPIGRPTGGAPSDSDVRLESSAPKIRDAGQAGHHDEPTLVMDALNLDAEAVQPIKPRPSSPKREEPSPFEVAGPARPASDSSSEFELAPTKDSGPSDSVFESASSSSELTLDLGSDLALGAGSGINLESPADKGISLEKGKKDSDEDLSLDLTPHAKKAGAKEEKDSSSEFELTLDGSQEADSGSEFELSLDADQAEGSSSEFELTLDDEGGLAPLDKPESDETEIGSSDFELAVEGDEAGVEGESEVVVIDEELGEEVVELEGGEEEAGYAEEIGGPALVGAGATKVPVEAAPADWGWWSLIHVPTALLMILGGFLLYEMMRSIVSFNQPTGAGATMFSLISNWMK